MQYLNHNKVVVFKWPMPAFFVYFRPFLITISIIQIEKSVDGVFGIWTWGHRIQGPYETTELWRPSNHSKVYSDMVVVVGWLVNKPFVYQKWTIPFFSSFEQLTWNKRCKNGPFQASVFIYFRSLRSIYSRKTVKGEHANQLTTTNAQTR